MEFENFLPPHQIHEIGEYAALSQTLGWGLQDLSIPSLWEESKGQNVRIAILDSGYAQHHELKHCVNLDTYRSFVKGEQWDQNGHGTSVAGVIAAKDDIIGMVGVAPEAELCPVKTIPNSGMFTDIKLLSDSLEYALTLNPDIINLSLGSYQKYPKYVEDIISEFHKRNIPFVCAAGNRADMPVIYPANYDTAIGVTSYKRDRIISDFAPAGDNIDFALPGDQIITTTLNNQYAIVSGSSFAAPFMSGILALLISYHKLNKKSYTIDSLLEKIKKQCIKIDQKDKHERFGFGIVNIKKLKDL